MPLNYAQAMIKWRPGQLEICSCQGHLLVTEQHKEISYLPFWRWNPMLLQMFNFSPKGSSGWRMRYFVLQENWWNRSLTDIFRNWFHRSQFLYLLIPKKE